MTTPKISFEFFPPRSDVQQRRFWSTLGCLQTLDPEYVSMTWGALGTTSQPSIDILEALKVDAKVPLAAHLTCVGHNEESIRKTILDLENLGIRRFVALRGDQPDGVNAVGYLQHASELVAILAENPERDISVAAYPELHPESPDPQQDLHWLKHKLDQGAHRAITQFFFSADTYLRFRDQATALGIHQELVPGILPIHDIDKVQDFSAKCGAQVSEALVERFKKAGDAKSAENCAVDQCVELIQTLHNEGVESFHLYTLNQSTLAYKVCKQLGRHAPRSVGAAA
ncbi:MAG: methylenetetrahydrofolate reductase [Granulosicoccus sp.]